MSSTKKIIAVVGATGNQGSSVAHTFIANPGWHVRCLTRNPTSPASKALAALGAEIAQADLADPASLSKAFSDANVVFLNTDFWETFTKASKAPEEGKSSGQLAFETEVMYGKNAAVAAAGIPSLERLIYSALPGATKQSGGKYTSNHSDSKGTVTEYILNDPVLSKKACFIYLGAYTANAILTPKFVHGGYNFILPLDKNVKMPIIDPKTSTGPLVHALLEEKVGTNLLAYDDHLSMEEVAELWSKASRQPAGYMQVPVDVLLAQGVSKEVLDVFGALVEFGYMGGLEYIEPSQLKERVETKSFGDWLKEQNWNEVLEAIQSGRTGMRKEE
jgi:hypothetical protein